MSVVAFLRRMLDAGLSIDQAMHAAELYEAGVEAARGSAAVDEAAERRRERDREYQAERRRQKSAESADVGRRRQTSADADGVGGAQRAPTRGLDKPLTGLDNNNHTTPSADASGWAPGDPPSQADLDRLERLLTEAGGEALADVAVAPRLKVLAPILALLRPGEGPAADLELDVLPVIRARAAKARPRSIASWDYFVAAIVETRDRRLAGAPRQASVGRPAPAAPDSADTSAWSEDRWRAALEVAADKGRWPAEWGPPPGEAGCRVPEALQGRAIGLEQGRG